MDQPVDQEDILPTPTQEEEAPVAEEEAEPTKSVKNFWERLDDVFVQNNELRDRMEELVSQFPEFQKSTQAYKTFLFQPSRLALCSNDDIQGSTYITFVPGEGVGDEVTLQTQGHVPAERFSQFRIRLKRPLRNVKSIQLLSAVIPNAIQSIPDDQIFFLYYKVRSVALANQGPWDSFILYRKGDIVTLGGDAFVALQNQFAGVLPIGPNLGVYWKQITLPANTARPNYYDLNPIRIESIFLTPTYYWNPDYIAAAFTNLFNRRFEDYNDLVTALNFIAGQFQRNNSSIANDISFEYDELLNKIIFVPNPAQIAAGYYYMPCGYGDKNVKILFEENTPNFTYNFNSLATFYNNWNIPPESILNTRLGFTWNGIFIDPFSVPDPWLSIPMMQSVAWYLRNQDPGFTPNADFPVVRSQLTFNSYPDLVNTSCVRLYADFALASTQDSLGTTTPDIPTTDGLLSIVPVNTLNLGVGYYQNNFNNPLTKIPENIVEIRISMLTDQGLPFYLPNSAVVLLELALDY